MTPFLTRSDVIFDVYYVLLFIFYWEMHQDQEPGIECEIATQNTPKQALNILSEP